MLGAEVKPMLGAEVRPMLGAEGRGGRPTESSDARAGPYTPLTLPTNREVYISVVAASFKK